MPPGTSSPSTVATRSSVTKSPSAAARSTGVSVAKRSRSASTCSSTSSSVTSTASSTVTARASYAGSSNSGRTSTSAVKVSFSPSSSSVTSTSGRPTGATPVSVDGLAVQAREGLLHGLLEHDAAADALVEDARRHLARAEALDPHLRADLLVRAVQLRLELVERDLDREADPRGAQGLDGALHRVVLSRVRGRAVRHASARGCRERIGRGGETRTPDLLLPKQAR